MGDKLGGTVMSPSLQPAELLSCVQGCRAGSLPELRREAGRKGRPQWPAGVGEAEYPREESHAKGELGIHRGSSLSLQLSADQHNVCEEAVHGQEKNH